MLLLKVHFKFNSMNNKVTTLIFALIILSSCNSFNKNEFSFYSWKSKAKSTNIINTALEICNTKSIYLHYFDVDINNDRYSFNDPDIYPTYVLKEVDEEFKNFNIIPVVFITNRSLKEAKSIEKLSEQISELIDEISLYHFKKTHTEIQLDCDWNQSTKNTYFELIEQLKTKYKVSVTIRLHQIKYQKKTGIPPAYKGILMVYNVGELKNENQNSILEANIVAQYINEQSTYPLELDIALPIFSQTVLKNNNGKLRLINTTERKKLESDNIHFTQLTNILFEVKSDTLFNGFYLSKGYRLKLEEVSEEETINTYKIIKTSNLNISKVIFYHLDDNAISKTNISKLISEL